MTPRNRRFAGSMVRGLYFRMEANSRAKKTSTLIHNVNVEVSKRSRAAGMSGGDVIGVDRRRRAVAASGAAVAPWPSRFWGGGGLQPLPDGEENRLRRSTRNGCPERAPKPD